MNRIKDYSKKWPPGPEKFTTVLKSFQVNEAQALLSLYQQYGDVVHYKMGATTHYLINNPDYIDTIFLVNDEYLSRDTRRDRIQNWGIQGDLGRVEGFSWEQNHNLIAPLLQEQLLSGDPDRLSATVSRHLSDWVLNSTENCFSLFPAVDNLVTELLWQEFIGSSEDSNDLKFARHLSSIEREFYRRSHLLYPLPPLRKTPRDRWFLRCTKQLRNIIEESLAGQVNHSSGFLKGLLASHDEQTRSQLSHERILDVLLGLFETAYSPLTSFLEFLLLSLASNTDEFTALQFELSRGNIPKSNMAMSAGLVGHCMDRSPVDCLMMETLRLFPPKFLVSRRVLKNLSVGGYEFERGSLVCVSPYALHRRPEQWSRADDFVPARFKDYYPGATEYLPFGLGVSQCLGESLLKRIGHAFVEQLAVHFKTLSIAHGGLGVSSGWTLQVENREQQVLSFQSAS